MFFLKVYICIYTYILHLHTFKSTKQITHFDVNDIVFSIIMILLVYKNQKCYVNLCMVNALKIMFSVLDRDMILYD